MFEFLLGGAIGIVLGWNILPQPAWVKNIYDKMFGPKV